MSWNSDGCVSPVHLLLNFSWKKPILLIPYTRWNMDYHRPLALSGNQQHWYWLYRKTSHSLRKITNICAHHFNIDTSLYRICMTINQPICWLFGLYFEWQYSPTVTRLSYLHVRWWQSAVVIKCLLIGSIRSKKRICRHVNMILVKVTTILFQYWVYWK